MPKTGEQSQIAKVAGSPPMSTKDAVHQFWVDSTHDVLADRPTGIDISRQQDGYWKYLDIWEKEIALNHLTPGVVLDLGCGTGRISKFLRGHGKQVVSSDYVGECLKLIKLETGQAPCIQMDSTSLGFKDSSFDCVVACRVLQSLPTQAEKEAAVQEIFRVLKRGGSLVLTEGNPARQKFVRVPYNFYLPIREWKKLLPRYGFSILKIYGVPFLTASKVLDKLSMSLLGRTTLPFKIANWLDRRLGLSPLKYLSLQFDIIARKR